MGSSLELSLGYLGALDDNGELDPQTGQAELEAAKVQTCVGTKTDGQAWLEFLGCLYDGDLWRAMPSGWQECADKSNVDVGVVRDCLESGEGDAALARAYAVSAASGIIQETFYGRSRKFSQPTGGGHFASLVWVT